MILRSIPIKSTSTTYLIINFGGPRDLKEVEGFLKELLTDQEVIRTPFPSFIHSSYHELGEKVCPNNFLICTKPFF
jgi:protoheme ferro-lyase